MSTIEGAVNPADAPPADSNNTEEQALAAAQAAAASGESARKDVSTAEVGAQTDNAAPPENADETPDAKNEREGFIPRDRFDQVNTKAAEEAAKRVEAETKLEALTQEQAIKDAAIDAGYGKNVAQYKHDNAWAEANGHGSIEQYIEVEQAKQRIAKQVLDGDITAEVQRERLQEVTDRARDRQRLHQVEAELSATRALTLNQTIAAAKADIGGQLSDAEWGEIEKLCRDIGRPDAVQRVIKTFSPAFKTATKTAAEKAVIDSNARKAANANGGAPPPEGRGGGQPPVQLPKMSPQQAKSMLISDLLGFRK